MLSALLSGPLGIAAPATRADIMRRRVGNTDLVVSECCLGGMTWGCAPLATHVSLPRILPPVPLIVVFAACGGPHRLLVPHVSTTRTSRHTDRVLLSAHRRGHRRAQNTNADAANQLSLAFDCGVNFIDTAEGCEHATPTGRRPLGARGLALARRMIG